MSNTIAYSHRVYVAGPWALKEKAKEVADYLRSHSLVVQSRWHDTTHNSNIYEATPVIMEEEALKDWEDVIHSSHLVYLNLQKSEGKATELGIALTRGLPIYVLGGRLNNVFLHLPWINHIESIDEVVKVLCQ